MADKIVDAGEKIGGARKDQYTRSITDLTEFLTSSEVQELMKQATKGKIWKKPDFSNAETPEELLSAALVKSLYDVLPQKPEIFTVKPRQRDEEGILELEENYIKESYHYYINAINAIKDFVTEKVELSSNGRKEIVTYKSPEEIIKGIPDVLDKIFHPDDKYQAMNEYFDRASSGYIASTGEYRGQSLNLRECYKTRFHNGVVQDIMLPITPLDIGYEKARDYFASMLDNPASTILFQQSLNKQMTKRFNLAEKQSIAYLLNANKWMYDTCKSIVDNLATGEDSYDYQKSFYLFMDKLAGDDFSSNMDYLSRTPATIMKQDVIENITKIKNNVNNKEELLDGLRKYVGVAKEIVVEQKIVDEVVEQVNKEKQDNLESYLKKINAENKKQLKEIDKQVNVSHLKHVKRVGPNWRNERNITTEEFMAEFGFRALEFGESLPNHERQTVLNLSYDSLCDLAYVLDIPKKELGLMLEKRDEPFKKSLALAFGSRGIANSQAHYEANRNVINLTRLKGAGSLAHEMWHAMESAFNNQKGCYGDFDERKLDKSVIELADIVRYEKLHSQEEYHQYYHNVTKEWNEEGLLDISKHNANFFKMSFSEYIELQNEIKKSLNVLFKAEIDYIFENKEKVEKIVKTQFKTDNVAYALFRLGKGNMFKVIQSFHEDDKTIGLKLEKDVREILRRKLQDRWEVPIEKFQSKGYIEPALHNLTIVASKIFNMALNERNQKEGYPFTKQIDLENFGFERKYYKDTIEISNIGAVGPIGYLAKPTELMARAFETIVERKLAEKGIENSYLVKDRSKYEQNYSKLDFDVNTGDVEIGNYNIYPVNKKDHDEIQQGFDNIIAEKMIKANYAPIPKEEFVVTVYDGKKDKTENIAVYQQSQQEDVKETVEQKTQETVEQVNQTVTEPTNAVQEKATTNIAENKVDNQSEQVETVTVTTTEETTENNEELDKIKAEKQRREEAALRVLNKELGQISQGQSESNEIKSDNAISAAMSKELAKVSAEENKEDLKNQVDGEIKRKRGRPVKTYDDPRQLKLF